MVSLIYLSLLNHFSSVKLTFLAHLSSEYLTYITYLIYIFSLNRSIRNARNNYKCLGENLYCGC